ncbi:MAG: hypothetical protein RQ729_01060 [Wenzhouxiangellaceae bacterium]|nr:hypothetical protein [Wenzhouxiangellaceae bacterium]
MRAHKTGSTESSQRPWLQHKRWQSTRLSCEGRSAMGVAIVFVLVWNLASAPLWFVIPAEFAAGRPEILIAVVFPLIGIGLIVWAAREVIRRRRYGESVLLLDALPVPLGGRLAATLQVPVRLQGRALSVQVSCVHRDRSRSGTNRNTTERVLWADQARIGLRGGSAPGQTSARIEMRLPDDRPPAGEPDARDRIIWRLEVGSEEPGVDYRALFELPVFDVGPQDADRTGSAADRPFAADDWNETGVQHGYVTAGRRFFFPRLRLVGAGLGTLVFALVFAGSGGFLLLGQGLWLFGGVFGLVGVLIGWAGLTMLLSSSEIVIGGGRLRWRHGVFGGWHEVETRAIRAIDITRSGSIGQTLYFRIRLERWGESAKVTIADWVPNERAARALAAHLADLTGIDRNA